MPLLRWTARKLLGDGSRWIPTLEHLEAVVAVVVGSVVAVVAGSVVAVVAVVVVDLAVAEEVASVEAVVVGMVDVVAVAVAEEVAVAALIGHACPLMPMLAVPARTRR